MSELLQAPKSGVKVRMYRQGHGDCFLLAFPREGGGRPVFMLIDCGYKPGSQIKSGGKKVDVNRVVKDIATVTDKKIDVVVVTHEHQDHVNGLSKFKDFEIGKAWFAWTEDPDDDDANALRERHGDQLIGLVGARRQLALAAAGDDPIAKSSLSRLDGLLALEIGSDKSEPDGQVVDAFSAAGDPKNSLNKKAMALIKNKAIDGSRYILPHKEILSIPEAPGVRVFPLGPPKDPDLLDDEDPKGDKAFPKHAAEVASFFAASKSQGGTGAVESMPFARKYGIEKLNAFTHVDLGVFFANYYGNQQADDPADLDESLSNASWRRVDEEWLYAAESFALKLNTGINNTSLVLAFELEKTRKVLLFAGDAQLGNWMSWTDGQWEDGDKTITARDLLARTVLYKVSHHCSHNATLKGKATDDYPNLDWMAKGKFADEFVAMITAHKKWANDTAHWDHPLDSIKEALTVKAGGRVFQTDTGTPDKSRFVSEAAWQRFMDPEVSKFEDLYFEYTILDE